MFELVKSLCNLYDLYFAWFILSIIWLVLILKKNKIKFSSLTLDKLITHLNFWFKLNLALAFIFYLLASTRYIPSKLLLHKEQKFEVLNVEKIDPNKKYFIHVLGSGYTKDERLYASQMLTLTALARLCEGIRLHHILENSKLVTSGASKRGIESQASVTKKAAIEMGIQPSDIYILEEPTTTSEEVNAFVSRFGTDVNLIVASDATHLPRALQMYKDVGIEAIAAPTNFHIKVDANHPLHFEFPNLESFDTANQYFLAVTKEWYYYLTGK